MSAAAILGAGFLQTAGSVYTNAMNTAASLAANKQNAAVQYAINADQIEAARMNNETAINLANTAHQREVQDLRDANLNPILSANGNGSAVPSLDTPGLEAPTANAPVIENPLSHVASTVASALQFADAHNLNQARLAAAGFTGDSKQDRLLRNALNLSNIRQAQSAASVAEAESAEAEARKALAAVEVAAARGVTGFNAVPGVNVLNPRAVELAREGIISDLKYRSNRNFREGMNTAKGVADTLVNAADAASGFVPGVKRRRP